ncbi:hypothetical protein [Sinosporangium siamense]|nr:hypothetical protein [Sinosporangium siamense]
MRRLIALGTLVALCGGCAAPRPFTPGDKSAAGASGSSSPASAPSPSASAGGGARSEVVTLSPDLDLVVQWPRTRDTKRAAMVKVLVDYYVETKRAVVSGGTEEGYKYLVQDEMSRVAYDWVQNFHDNSRSLQGKARLYAIRVKAVVGVGAEVEMCVNEAELRLTDAETGFPVAEQPSWTRPPESTYIMVAGVRQGDDGRWRVKTASHATLPHPRAKECQR